MGLISSTADSVHVTALLNPTTSPHSLFSCPNPTPEKPQFNSYWMADNGFVPREATGDVRDLIARRHLDGEDVFVNPTLPVEQAIRRMRAHGISQMAVLVPDGGTDGAAAVGSPAKPPAAAANGGGPATPKAAKASRVVGILDESDLLLALLRDGKSATSRPVSLYMESRVETVPPTAAVADLLPILRAGRVVVVAGEGGLPFYGLITNIDIINYLRAKVE
jgi:cystathionine beta-synthase